MIKIDARLDQAGSSTRIRLRTNDQQQEISIPAKPNGQGLAANGGELLFLARAACYCTDLYRAANRRGLTRTRVEVSCQGSFEPVPGAVAEGVGYRARVHAPASEAEILELLRHTDTVAEIHNTLRRGVPVRLEEAEAVDTR